MRQRRYWCWNRSLAEDDDIYAQTTIRLLRSFILNPRRRSPQVQGRRLQLRFVNDVEYVGR